MTEYKSDVARIRAQIEDEYRVMQLMKSGVAITSKHQFIDARMHRVDQHHQALIPLVGADAAIAMVAEINELYTNPTPAHPGPTVLLSGEDFSAGYHGGYLYFYSHCRQATFTDLDISHLINQQVLSVLHSDRYNAGFIVGFVAALHHARALPAQIVEE